MPTRPEDDNPGGAVIFSRSMAAQMARVPLEFLELVEAEALLTPRATPGGEPGYSARDIERLARIRRLHELLGLDLAAVEVVLHLREQIEDLMARLEEMERRFAERERELLEEIEALRRRLLVGR